MKRAVQNLKQYNIEHSVLYMGYQIHSLYE